MIDLNELTKKVFIVAELSANHNGSKKVAIETIKAAKIAGADAIKLQTYTADTITIKSKKKDFIINSGSIWDGDYYYNLYKNAHTPWDWHKELFNVAREEGLICFSSPFDFTAVDFLEELDNPIYKIASFEITDIPLIKYISSKGKPIIISTGIANIDDINLAIKTIRSQGDCDIAVLKCTSSYPAPINEANLLMINDIKKRFNVIPGLSDHTLGIVSPIVATCMGAKIIEKHFILDKSLGGPDASFSLDRKQFKNMVQAIRDAEKSIGAIDYTLTENQLKGKDFSRSLYVIKDIKKGEVLTDKNIKSIRPGFGLHPKYYEEVIGKKVNKNLERGMPLKINFIEFK
ncbi:MAG: pseudaminic acid synthase [Flavobacteriaceae bacterium]|nr:pseudaminic acid synthase [Flavobacteriaceae bacterium]